MVILVALLQGELKTRVGAHMIPGRPFEIDSVTVPVSQTRSASSVPVGEITLGQYLWAIMLPEQQSDIEVTGGAAVGGGPGAVDVGGEFGAQSSEDLN